MLLISYCVSTFTQTNTLVAIMLVRLQPASKTGQWLIAGILPLYVFVAHGPERLPCSLKVDR